MHAYLLFAFGIVLSCTASGSWSAEIREGQWLEVRGQLQADREFTADKITLSEPDDEAAITATVTQNLQGQLTLLRHVLTFDEDATFQGIDRNQLLGSRIKAQGDLAGPWVLSVEDVKRRDTGRDRIEGPVDGRPNGNVQFQVLGYRIRVTDNTEFVGFNGNGFPTLSKTETPKLFASRFSIDRMDDDDRFGDGIKLSDDIRLTSRIVGESAWEDNFNFNDIDNEDRQDLGLNVRTRLEWDPQSAWNGVFELRYSARHRERQDRRKDDESTLEVGEAFLRRQVNDTTQITVGRQDFDDKREWLFDQNLDAIRLTSWWSGLEFEASVSKIFADDNSREEEAINYIVAATRTLADGSVSAYYVNRDFAREHDEESYHYGLSAHGEWLQSAQVWIEIAKQGGKRNRRPIKAYAADIGGTWQLNRNGPWYGSIGLAFASGDDPATRDIETFRQTGLQDNNGKLGGLTSFRYYGELSDPELSNLWISTIGVGRRILETLSIDLVAHVYRLDEVTTELDEVEWDSGLSGTSTNLGWETDVILGLRGLEQWEVEAVFGYFDPGKAFIDDRPAWFGKFQLKFRH